MIAVLRWRRRLSERRIVRRLRPLLMTLPAPIAVRNDTLLKLGPCHALRRASNRKLLGYRVRVLIDPSLGVP